MFSLCRFLRALLLLTFTSPATGFAAEPEAPGTADLLASLGSAPPHCDAPALNLPRDAESARRSVVTIQTPGGTGTGFFVSSDGLLLTAAHVVGSHASVEIVLQGGLKLRADVQRRDESPDLALLDAPGDGHACLALARERPSIGADLYVIGAPLGVDLSGSLSRGVVSSFRSLDGITLVQTDASVNPGNSGGPALDSSGRVLGVIRSKIAMQGFEGIGFAVWAGDVSGFLANRPAMVFGVGGLGVSPSAGRAHLTITTNKERVAIARKTGEKTSMVTGMAITQEFTEDLCVAPCSLELSPGKTELLAAWNWSRIRTTTELPGGGDVKLDAHFRSWPSKVGAALIVPASLSLFTGGMLWGIAELVDDGSLDGVGRAMTLGGALGVGVSIPILVTDRARWRVVEE